MAESSTSTVENKSTKDSTMGNGKQGHAPASHSKLTTDHGNTSIADTVVAKIAGLAAREIPGVQAMGGGMSRKMGQLRSLVPGNGDGLSRGVSVEVGEREAAVDLDLVTWYGQSIVEVSDAVRSNVIERIEAMTGLKTVEVNINVDDVHVQGDDDDDDDDSESRVQ